MILKHKITLYILAFIFLSTYGYSKNIEFQSAYSDINIKKNCQTIITYAHNIGAVFDCGRFANISIEIASGDLRDTVDLIRDGKRYDLNFSQAITPHFTALGDKMEWRFQKGHKTTPSAMIVRLNIDIEGKTQKDRHKKSYLIVSKITEETICIVGKISPQKNQNILARKMADKASTLGCVLDNKNNKRIW
ncbi:hypothetical protein MNB_SV-13-1055 [hydrothermal vent metagenome]|uniref:Uncharacterized protein n=1 Tax=hydrothermal vent metagenome TaxID=652676 RepID=A0A1W1CPE1_9ZZZZ